MRNALIVGSALAIALVLGACEDKVQGRPDPGPSRAGAPGSEFEDTQSLVNAANAGIEKAKAHRVEMTMDLGSTMSVKVDGEMEYAGSYSEMQIAMKITGVPVRESVDPGGTRYLSVEIIVADGTIYMKAATQWFKVSLDSLGLNGQHLTRNAKLSDPSDLLKMVKENGQVLNVAESQVHGKPATKYTVEVDAQKLLDTLWQAPQMPAADTLNSPSMDVWLNEENLPVQVELDLSDLMKQVCKVDAVQGESKVTAQFSGWGEPVTFKAPPDYIDVDGDLVDLPPGVAPETTCFGATKPR